MKRYLLLALMGLSFTLYQNDVDGLVQRLTAYSLKYPQEKIFIHFDKPYYNAGETLWFKAYLVEATQNLPSKISKVLYVDLLNDDFELIETKNLKVVNGGAPGEFELQDIPAGTYHIRAYTQWMQNFDNSYFFRKSVKVIGAQRKDEFVEQGTVAKISFFPEGGELIDGLTSIVAIKSTDQYGRGISVSGNVVNDGQTITFETNPRGMGALLVTPSGGQVTGDFKFGGTDYSFDLPISKKEGYTMQVINSYESEKVTIIVRSKGKKLKNGGLIAHQSGKVFYSALNKGNNDSFAVGLDRSDFPSGICHITFFDPDGRPQAERLLYANYPETYNIRLSKQSEFKPRSKVTLNLQSVDSVNPSSYGNLSISITPRSLVQFPEYDQNVINYLMLTSDLAGRIEQPDYYLFRNRESFKSLDLLLLTQGWRRFKWDDVLSHNTTDTPLFWAEDGIGISGRVVDYYDHEKPRESTVTLSLMEGSLTMMETETDANGQFYFGDNHFEDSIQIFVQAKRKLRKEGKFRNDVFVQLSQRQSPKIDSSLYQRAHGRKATVEERYKDEYAEIKEINEIFEIDDDAIMLDAVEVMGQNNRVDDPLYEYMFKIYDKPTKQFVLDSVMKENVYVNTLNMLTRLPGVRVTGVRPNQKILLRGAYDSPLILVNGIEMPIDNLYIISPQEINHIDLIIGPDAAIYGSQGANGVLAIYTRNRLGSSHSPIKGILNRKYPGYSQIREFYSPNYEKPLEEHAKPDYRTTLYWNPSVILGKVESESLSFYSSDQVGKFDIIIQGIADGGFPVFLKDSLEVK